MLLFINVTSKIKDDDDDDDDDDKNARLAVLTVLTPPTSQYRAVIDKHRHRYTETLYYIIDSWLAVLKCACKARYKAAVGQRPTMNAPTALRITMAGVKNTAVTKSIVISPCLCTKAYINHQSIKIYFPSNGKELQYNRCYSTRKATRKALRSLKLVAWTNNNTSINTSEKGKRQEEKLTSACAI